jgi:hypothetical protein
MFGFLVLTAVTFSLFGFIIGIWADGFEKLQVIPMLILTPLTFLGGAPATIGALICGTFGAGFLLAGFASFHFRTRGKSWRLPVLWIAYLSVFVFTIPAFFFLLSGLIDTRRTIAVTPVGKN